MCVITQLIRHKKISSSNADITETAILHSQAVFYLINHGSNHKWVLQNVLPDTFVEYQACKHS